MPWSDFRRYVDRYVEHFAADGQATANLKEIAAAVGASFAQVRRATDTQRVAFHTADVWACRLGVHPSVIWGEAYWVLSDQITEHHDEMLRRRVDSRNKYAKKKEVSAH